MATQMSISNKMAEKAAIAVAQNCKATLASQTSLQGLSILSKRSIAFSRRGFATGLITLVQSG